MFIVFLVDGKTRILLPDNQWGLNVRQNLRINGHTVSPCADQNREPGARDEAELSRVDDLLDEIGL